MATPRTDPELAFEVFMAMPQDEWDGLIRSLMAGGALEEAEGEGFKRAMKCRDARTLLEREGYVVLSLREAELVHSSLRYYKNGVAYQAYPGPLQGTDDQVSRRLARKMRASELGQRIVRVVGGWTVDEDGLGITVKRVRD